MARWSAARRRAALAEGKALPPLTEGEEPRFPIADCDDFENAVRDLNRIPEGERDRVRRHIAKRGIELGCQMPEGWRMRSGRHED